MKALDSILRSVSVMWVPRSLLLAEIAEVPDISFKEKACNVTEDKKTVSVCAVAGQLAEDVLPLKVVILTANDTAKSKLGVSTIGVSLSEPHSSKLPYIGF